jgi:hypothetical protein
MKHGCRILVSALALALAAAGALCAAPAPGSLVCVGVYSETDAGYVSYRVGAAAWQVIKVGDVLPPNAEVKINVDRDWVEFIQSGRPEAVYEIVGPESGELVKKAAEVLKLKPRAVSFPKGTAAKPDPKYKNKLVVQQYLGRQVYMTADGDSKDIKYGDVLDISGKVRIIAINNTLTLMNASGGVTTVIGPLNFTVEQVINNKALYKFLNVQK